MILFAHSPVLFTLFSAVTFLSAAPVRAEPPRTLKPEDSAAIRVVDEPQISPDGNSIVYTVKTTDLDADGRT